MKSFPLTLLALAAGSTLALSGCEKALDKVNLTNTGGDLIYNDSTLANMSLSYVYDQNLPDWAGQGTTGLANTNFSTLSDESYGESKYFEGTIQAADVTDFGTALDKGNNYGKIRIINMFIRDVKASKLTPGSKYRLNGQAQFFRAYRYFDLVRTYGGVPLVMSPLNAVGVEARDLTYLPRNTTAETFAAIVADLDSAITVLPGRWSQTADWGRITKGAAAAFKARVLLYAASPQFNTNDDVNRWQAAYNASMQAKTLLTANGFGLHASFDQLWFQEVNNPEAVLVTGYNTSTGDQTKKNNKYDVATRPAYTGTGGGSNQPTWEMVKAFPMADGKKPGESTLYPYTDQTFYKNRDPRFEKTIAYNGSTWPLNGNTAFRLWTYYRGTPSASVEPGSKPSQTGFYTRKAINPTAGVSDAVYVGTDWIELRYAEVLLNLAEAACGINNLTEAYTQLKAIRARAGIPAGGDGNYGLQAGMTRAQMFDAIMYERQIEFAFEGKRFWDLRRWKKIESVLNGKRRTGVTITLKTTAPADFATTRDNMTLDAAYTNFNPIVFKNLDTRYVINWRPEYYYFAIPPSAIDNNPKLMQTAGWNGGAFVPTL